jgi:TonB family protein
MPTNRQSGALMAAVLAVLTAAAWLLRPRPEPPLPPRRTRELITTASLPIRATPSAALSERSPAAATVESASFEVRLPTAAPTDVPRPARIPLSAQGEIHAPELLQRVEPAYPERLRQARIEGTVVLEAMITERGEVTGLRVSSSTNPELEEPAVAAVSQWRYKPATLRGEAVPVYLTITTKFRLRP